MDEQEMLQIEIERKKRNEYLEKEALIGQQQTLSGALNQGYQEQSPREYLHRFLLEAKHSGCSVDHYIDAEIKKMLNELGR